MHVPRIPLLLLALSACVLGDVDLGEGLDSTGANASDSGDTSTVTTTDDLTTGWIEPEPQGIGAPCDHGWESGSVPESKLLTFPALGCSGLVCVYADIAEAPAGPCSSDLECNADHPGLDRFACNPLSGCELSPRYFAERSMCSDFCDVDADCATDEPTSCATGFVCAPISTLGDSCCRPVCVCADDLDVTSTSDIVADCGNGSAPCCGLEPGNGLCPD